MLAVLSRYPGLAAREVAERTQMDAVAVSRAVTRLLRDGRLNAHAVAQTTGAARCCRCPARGAAVYGRIAPLALDYERALLAVLNAGERAMLDDILTKLTGRAGDLARELEQATRPPRVARRRQ